MNNIQKQIAFEKMITGLYHQGALSFYVEGTSENRDFGVYCRYRQDGKKCAIGHLIPDQFYHPELETKGMSDPSIKAVLRKSLNIPRLMEDDLLFFQRAQECLHDDIVEKTVLENITDPKDIRAAIISAANVFADVHHYNKEFLDDLVNVSV